MDQNVIDVDEFVSETNEDGSLQPKIVNVQIGPPTPTESSSANPTMFQFTLEKPGDQSQQTKQPKERKKRRRKNEHGEFVFEDQTHKYTGTNVKIPSTSMEQTETNVTSPKSASSSTVADNVFDEKEKTKTPSTRGRKRNTSVSIKDPAIVSNLVPSKSNFLPFEKAMEKLCPDYFKPVSKLAERYKRKLEKEQIDETPSALHQDSDSDFEEEKPKVYHPFQSLESIAMNELDEPTEMNVETQRSIGDLQVQKLKLLLHCPQVGLSWTHLHHSELSTDLQQHFVPTEQLHQLRSDFQQSHASELNSNKKKRGGKRGRISNFELAQQQQQQQLDQDLQIKELYFEPVQYEDTSTLIPMELVEEENANLWNDIFSIKTWEDRLSDQEKSFLQRFLPNATQQSHADDKELAAVLANNLSISEEDQKLPEITQQFVSSLQQGRLHPLIQKQSLYNNLLQKYNGELDSLLSCLK